MDTIDDVHLQFARYFRAKDITGYLYLLSRKMEEGSTCLSLTDIPTMQPEGLPFNPAILSAHQLEKSGLVGDAHTLDRPFVFDRQRLYFQRYYKYEVRLIEKIREMVTSGAEKQQTRRKELASLSDAIQRYFPEGRGADWQKTAALLALCNDFTIITGGPGTGKTTTVAKILALLLQADPAQKIALAAPTGKAAARMAESLAKAAGIFGPEIRRRFAEMEPSTIHRLLGTVKGSIYFRHNRANPLSVDTVVVDESSMIDIALFSKLLDAVGNDTRIILLGDKDQLSSVEVGSLFGDLCRTVGEPNRFTASGIALLQPYCDGAVFALPDGQPAFLQDHLVELKESHRFKSTEGIGRLSHAVIQNDQALLTGFLQEGGDDRVLIDTEQKEAVWRRFVKGYEAYIREPDTRKALVLLDHQRILCAIREGNMGVYAWNRKVEMDLLEKGLIDPAGDVFYTNRPVIVTRNNYELGLYNGDVGILRPDNEGAIKAWFADDSHPDGLKSVAPGLISGMETVYAMTIHKSQGSEFDTVMIVLPEEAGAALLTREILYTAITRARQSVVLRTSAATLLEICGRQVERSSGVAARI